MGYSLFNRPHHQAIEAVLLALSPDFLREHACFFGGGTAISLRYGEFRESVDIDFLVSDLAGYRAIRQMVTESGSLANLLRPGALINEIREARTGPNSIISAVESQGARIKFEIVLEARISFDQPGPTDSRWTPAARPFHLGYSFTCRQLAKSWRRNLRLYRNTRPSRRIVTRNDGWLRVVCPFGFDEI